MKLILKIAEDKEIKLVQDFFKKYLGDFEIFLQDDSTWIISYEFLCPYWVKWAVKKGNVVILKNDNKIYWALRFYPRKRDNITSIYQFALDKKVRWKRLIFKMLEKTWYENFESTCFLNSKFNEYYKKLWWKLKRSDDKFNYRSYATKKELN